MLFNLLLATITILLCFLLLFLVILSSFFITSVFKESARVKLALAIPAGTPITRLNTQHIYYLLSFLLVIFLSRISELN